MSSNGRFTNAISIIRPGRYVDTFNQPADGGTEGTYWHEKIEIFCCYGWRRYQSSYRELYTIENDVCVSIDKPEWNKNPSRCPVYTVSYDGIAGTIIFNC